MLQQTADPFSAMVIVDPISACLFRGLLGTYIEEMGKKVDRIDDAQEPTLSTTSCTHHVPPT